MAENPDRFVRVSTPDGHFTVSRVAAERGSLTVLKQDAVDKFGHPLPAKPRVAKEETPKAAKRSATRKRAASKLRGETAAATPTTEPGTVSGDTV